MTSKKMAVFGIYPQASQAQTAVGVTAGGAIGGVIVLLAGIGATDNSSIGPIDRGRSHHGRPGGPWCGGAVGGLVGALTGLGIPEYEAKRYEGRVKGSGTLLSVHCDTSDEISRAKSILKGTRAEDIAATSESSSPKTASAA